MTDNERAGFQTDATRPRHRYRGSDDEPPSLALVSALAEYRQVDPIELGDSLHEHVDLEALDALFGDRTSGATRTQGAVGFDVDDLTVVVRGNDVVLCDRPDGDAAGETFDDRSGRGGTDDESQRTDTRTDLRPDRR